MRGVTFYGLKDYQGGHGFLAPGFYLDEYDLDLSNVKSDYAESVKVDTGITATIYSYEYLDGPSLKITESTSDLKPPSSWQCQHFQNSPLCQTNSFRSVIVEDTTGMDGAGEGNSNDAGSENESSLSGNSGKLIAAALVLIFGFRKEIFKALR